MTTTTPSSASDRSRASRRPRPLRGTRFPLLALAISLVLTSPPWWMLVMSGTAWPRAVVVVGSVLFALVWLVLPALMLLGHGPRQWDLAARVGDSVLGLSWVLFTWTVLSVPLWLVLVLFGVADPVRSRTVAVFVVLVTAGLGVYGHLEARRVPRVRALDVMLPRLGGGFDGLRVVVLSDTHFGPLDRTNWSKKVVARVNELGADVVCHLGDVADGPVGRRGGQVAPLGEVRAGQGRYYITGNHEYFGHASEWLDRMRLLGWEPLHNAHAVLRRGGDRLVLAGIDDPTGSGRLPGHGPDLGAALDAVDPELPVVLLAHQPRQVRDAVLAGVDLQISGHTHGGQIWPFHYLVRTDQPSVSGLSRHGPGTQLYTSRGTGFWGPPLRVFAPSEITLLTLRAAAR